MKGRRRRQIFAGMAILLAVFAAGCQNAGTDAGERIAVEFTVVEDGAIPAELKDIIESHKTQEIKMTFEGKEEGKDGLYLIRGYGEQPTGGYSISADRVELAADGLHVTTTLIGPSGGENPAPEPSYPYLVLWVAKTGQEVQFE